MTTLIPTTVTTSENGFSFEASYNGSKIIEDELNYGTYVNLNITRRPPGMVPEPPGYLVTSVTVLYVLIFIIGIIGNIMVVIVVGCSRNLRTTINIYIVNLCIADFLVFFVCLPPILVELHVKEIWYFGEIMCKTVPFLEVVVASASVFTIIAITIERFRVVFKPLSITNDNLSYAVKSVIVIWIAGIILSSPILFIVIYKDSRLKDGTPIKVCRMPAKYDWQKSYFVLVALFNYILPCIIIAVLYFFLCKKLVLKRNIALDSYDINYREKLRLRKQVMQIIWTIVLVFFICHLPFRVVSMWWIFEDKMKIASLGLEINLAILYYSRLFLFLNHAINPILYNFVSTKFRHSCFNLLFSNHRRNSSVRTQERKLQKITDSLKHNTPIVNLKNGTCKENIRLVKVDDDHRSSSSTAGRERINDFSPLYYKQISNVNSEGDNLLDLGRCKFQIGSTKDTPSLTNDQSVDENRAGMKTVKLFIDEDGYVVAVKLRNNNNNFNEKGNFKCRVKFQ